MEIKEVPYFCFEVNDWENNSKEIRLENLEDLPQRLEMGESLFKVFPKFSSQLGRHEFFRGYFAKREEIEEGDKIFYSDEGFTKVGNLFVPEDNIKSRNQLRNDIALKNFPETPVFYMSQVRGIYTPFEQDGITILKREQVDRTHLI